MAISPRNHKTARTHDKMRKRITSEMQGLRTIAPILSKGPSSDPVTQYLQRVAETFGLGFIPPDMGGATPKQRFKYLLTETQDIIRELFGPSWKKFIGHVGMPRDVMPLLTGRYKYTTGRIHELRLVHMTLLVHIAGIKQDLEDTERKLWTLIQQGHDPHFTGEDARISSAGHINRGRQHIREALGKMMVHVPKPYYLPLRALAMIEYPHLDSREAKILLEREMIQRGEINKAWLSQSHYDGLTEEQLTGIYEPIHPTDTGFERETERRARLTEQKEANWYARWRSDWKKEHGKAPPTHARFFTPEMRKSFEIARERGKLDLTERRARKKIQRKLTPQGKIDGPLDIDAYLEKRRNERKAEQRRFLRFLNRHAGEDGKAERLLREHFDKIKREKESGEFDGDAVYLPFFDGVTTDKERAWIEARLRGFEAERADAERLEDMPERERALLLREWLLTQCEDGGVYSYDELADAETRERTSIPLTGGGVAGTKKALAMKRAAAKKERDAHPERWTWMDEPLPVANAEALEREEERLARLAEKDRARNKAGVAQPEREKKS